VSARILAGGATHSAYLLYVSPWQINAILPSNAPVGGAQLTVTYGSLTSQPAPIQIVSTAPGIFFQPPNTAIAQNVASPTNYPLNQASTTDRDPVGDGHGPNRGSGQCRSGRAGRHDLGVRHNHGRRHPRAAAICRTPASLRRCGQHLLHVPQGVPYGCNIPVAIAASGVPANTATIAITPDASPYR
jgi:hypothetical protein